MCVGVDAPCSQTSFGYLSLALVYGSVLLYRRQKLLVCLFSLHCSAAQLLVKLKLWGEGRAIGCKDLSCFWGSEKRDVLFVRVAGFLVLVSPFRFCRCSRQLPW
jgi:hypothetical protein